ncbi:MAG: heat-inducible transcription repressor HrcA [Coriobacteriaceae bacterium]|nr:heat-inducible transcription repressor HrcA [Coriobacteriaceae bacterium]
MGGGVSAVPARLNPRGTADASPAPLALAILECQRQGGSHRMLNDRRRLVLAALVEEYIRSAQPVASQRLVQRYELGCSPATVRNELSILEETGYVFQPHVSAGRVPTDTGYRQFVDGVTATREGGLTPAEIEAVHDKYVSHAAEIDELMHETAAMLSRLTSYVAVVLTPAASRARIRRVDLVSLTSRRALVVVITDSGQVFDRALDLDQETSPEDLALVERALNEAMDGKVAEDARPGGSLADAARVSSALVSRVVDEVLDCLMEADRARARHGGTAALLEQPEFAGAENVRPLLELLEDGVALLETLTDVIRERDVVVRIGHENQRGELEHASFVAATYGDADNEGIVGVIGPTRMDYARAISAVRTVSSGLSDVLGEA